ncbi:MAG: DEAD/DEAH box helicase [Gemmatimonadaceae bacterium]
MSQNANNARFPELVEPPALPAARAALAACMLGDHPATLRVGDITLHRHQRSAVARIQRNVSRYGGALLCDRVGLGKTYVALAVASNFDRVTIIAPASLAPMWRRALQVTKVRAEVVSIESLGRNGARDAKCGFIVVDEAHNFRNPCTRRYSELARMCALAPALLLTATPLHNSRDDLCAIAALFIGSRAYAMSDADLAPMIVRRDSAGDARGEEVPVIEHAPPVVLNTTEEILDRIIALPAPVPPSDGNAARQLVIHGLVHQWASSTAALAGAVKRRIARSQALLASLDAGRYPTTAELSAWVYTGDAVQLPFAEWLPRANTPLSLLSAALRHHVDALGELLSAVKRSDDGSLASFVSDLRAAHPGERIVAFSCYSETATEVYHALRHQGHAALLTARGATIATGPVGRAEILNQFAPDAPAASSVADHARVTLLITTDLLSEGVNLQEASVVVNLDLPWTAARLDQRIGRLARLGSRHQRVVSYTVHPTPRAEAFLHELEIIARKGGLATELLGEPALNSDRSELAPGSTLQIREQTRAMLERWLDADSETATVSDTQVALACTRSATSLGAWLVDGEPALLIWSESYGITNDPMAIYAAACDVDAAADRTARPADSELFHRVIQAANGWYEQRNAWIAIGGCEGPAVSTNRRDPRRSLARVADSTANNATFARRTPSVQLASRLLDAASTPLPIAVEWSLQGISESLDEAAVDTILELVDRSRAAATTVRERGLRCVALILARSDP